MTDLILDGHAHSSNVLPPMPSQNYAHDAGCLALNDSDTINFHTLLSSIRRHLYTSVETQGFYVLIAQEIYSKLLAKHTQVPLDHEPCLDDFQSFVINHWPTFRSIKGSSSSVMWGRVSKSPEDSRNEIEILNSLISAAEVANSQPQKPDSLSIDLYNLILTVIILHEISHSFTKHLFGSIITPEGVGLSQHGFGESEWLLEAKLMGGSVLASWDCQGHVGRMSLIKRVVLEINNDLAYIIDVNAAKSILQSLGSLSLTPPLKCPLVKSPGGDFRAPVTKKIHLPKQHIITPIGLGFRSYLGSDRWETPPSYINNNKLQND